MVRYAIMIIYVIGYQQRAKMKVPKVIGIIRSGFTHHHIIWNIIPNFHEFSALLYYFIWIYYLKLIVGRKLCYMINQNVYFDTNINYIKPIS